VQGDAFGCCLGLAGADVGAIDGNHAPPGPFPDRKQPEAPAPVPDNL
jgi:hypothetical protein